MDLPSPVLLLLNEFISFHHVHHEAMDKFLGGALEKHGCWCPTLSKTTSWKALRGTPAGGLGSWDHKCQEHSQCSTCVHNSVPRTEKSSILQFYTVKFVVDRNEPKNMAKTRIVCNPARFQKKNQGTWLDEDYNEQSCRCDAALVRTIVDFYVGDHGPDPTFNGQCRPPPPAPVKAVAPPPPPASAPVSPLSPKVDSPRGPPATPVQAMTMAPMAASDAAAALWDEERSIFEYDSDRFNSYADNAPELESGHLGSFVYDYPEMDAFDVDDDGYLEEEDAAFFEASNDHSRPSSGAEIDHRDPEVGTEVNRSLDGPSNPDSASYFSDGVREQLAVSPQPQRPKAVDHAPKVCCMTREKVWVPYHKTDPRPSECTTKY